jgi:uncharacterized protein YcbK (DUF882 family)
MKLARNFSKSEFDSKDGAEMPNDVLENVKKLASYLQILRDHLDKSIKINSGYRSPSYNKKIGKPKSIHLLGLAADIVVSGMKPKEVFKEVEKLQQEGKLPQGGLSAYATFLHIDFRGKKARW